ncbi:MAG: aminotransferase class V-fold PLP-dependent enzyme, partial [Clostridiaceae bacterium]|nr:aminotransferase class V-fold PLP-dependent enzyme [Clostridiaceae bacterium]
IATRAGAHCAPLLHKHFKTETQGMVRFSFSQFNREDEIDQGIRALQELANR